MSRVTSLQRAFKRYRRPGDIVCAWGALIVAVALLAQILEQTAWRPGGKFLAQPRFWPAVSLGGMAVFAALHLVRSALSERIGGRWQEIRLWLRSLEYVAWFIAYAVAVPWGGYLACSLVFALMLTLRVGYRSVSMLIAAPVTALVIVFLFRALLKVNLPAGRVVEVLPDGLRRFMLIYF
ncbi:MULTISPECIES: tripartite tricarboxylate transporter TctB family protein [unclassified Marinovum]